jgi:hypothetical protein
LLGLCKECGGVIHHESYGRIPARLHLPIGELSSGSSLMGMAVGPSLEMRNPLGTETSQLR